MQVRQRHLWMKKRSEWFHGELRFVQCHIHCKTSYCTFMQLFERRSKLIQGQNERSLWKHITPAYMSDEETDTENGGFTLYKPKWRSDLLNRLLLRLDKRYEESRKKSRAKPREKRVVSSQYSSRRQPLDALNWTVRKTPSNESRESSRPAVSGAGHEPSIHLPPSPRPISPTSSPRPMSPRPTTPPPGPTSPRPTSPRPTSPRRTSFMSPWTAVSSQHSYEYDPCYSGMDPPMSLSSQETTPSGIPGHVMDRTHLFASDESDVDSEDDLNTLIRKVTRELNK